MYLNFQSGPIPILSRVLLGIVPWKYPGAAVVVGSVACLRSWLIKEEITEDNEFYSIQFRRVEFVFEETKEVR